MKNFTFVTLTYNHQDYIVEHLETVKNLVFRYGEGIDVDLLIMDDHSSDETVSRARKWLDENAHIFRKYQVIANEENVGVVRNILNSITYVETDEMKFIAGDDKFKDADLFSMYDRIEKNMLLMTPVETFGFKNPDAERNLEDAFSLVRYMNGKGKLADLISIKNFISAPGVFFRKSMMTDPAFLEFMKNFRNIEDYPMWHYFIVRNHCKVLVIKESYVMYRIGSGVSSNTTHKKRTAYTEEVEKIRKLLDVKFDKYPKLLNPYRYKLYFWRKQSK